MTSSSSRRPAEGSIKGQWQRKSPWAWCPSASLGFTANECLDFGIDLGSPVGLEDYDQAPFKFNGKIEQAHVEYTK